VADARRLTKDLLSLIGLKMRRGRRVRINGTRDYDAEIVNVGELKHLLYLRACGREGTKLPDGVELVFPELAKDAHILADAEAMDWYKDQNEEVQGMVRGEIEYVGFAAAVDLVKRFIA